MISGQKWEIYKPKKIFAQKGEVSTMFSSLSNAQEVLVSQWHVASYSTRDMWDPTSEKLPAFPQTEEWQKKSITILARWSSAYDAFLGIQGSNLTDKRKKGTAALCILKELGSTVFMLTRTMIDDQKNWDIFCPMFQKVVSLAEDIVKVDLNSTAERSTHCIDMALVGPLFKVSLLSNASFLV
jgi:hypothetical protein